jgi:4-hydroxymandelate oxidase
VSADVRELERQAKGWLHPDVYDFIAGGSGRERTLRANVKAWRQVPLLPRVLRDVSAVDTRAEVNGTSLATPIGVAPTAAHRMVHPDGEVATAVGAAGAGALYVLSTRSSRRIEEVGAALAAAVGTWWFQAYLMRDRELTAGLVRRAAAAGAAAVVLTADTPVVGHKRRDRGGGVVRELDFMANLDPQGDPAAREQSAGVTFADIGWLGEVSGGLPVIVKGVLRPGDALDCASHGAAGVIVSNHGGRQLDGAVATALALPGVVTALASRPGPRRCEVYVDGGLRRGEDVLAALALGARAVFLGRPVLWALAAGGTAGPDEAPGLGGAAGVRDLLTALTADLAHAMALAGARDVAALDGLVGPGEPPRATQQRSDK